MIRWPFHCTSEWHNAHAKCATLCHFVGQRESATAHDIDGPGRHRLARIGIVAFTHFDYSSPRFWTTGGPVQGWARVICSRVGDQGRLSCGSGDGSRGCCWSVLAAPFWGCAHGPRSFRKVQNQAPFVRARAVGLARRQPDSRALSALVERLSDGDPVVRLAAHEELRRRTGRDFGYVPWASAEERAGAISRWRNWVSHGERTSRRGRRLRPCSIENAAGRIRARHRRS